jgi:hypothetical protein
LILIPNIVVFIKKEPGVEEEDKVVEEEEVEEQEVVEEEEEEEVEEQEQEVEEEEEEQEVEEEQQEEEVEEIVINGKTYYTSDSKNGALFEADENGDISNEVGVLKDGKPHFHT